MMVPYSALPTTDNGKDAKQKHAPLMFAGIRELGLSSDFRPTKCNAQRYTQSLCWIFQKTETFFFRVIAQTPLPEI